MKRFYRVPFFLVVFALTIESCKKDVLIDDSNEPIVEYDSLKGLAEGLEGMWEWFLSTGSGGTKYPNFYYSTPQTEGYTLSLMFRKDGQYRKYRNDSLIEYGGITYEIGQQGSLWGFSMYFIHNSKKEWTSGEIIENDTLRLSTYPFEDDIQNYFVRK